MMNGNGTRPEQVVSAAREATAALRDLRIMRAEHGDRGWKLKYITLGGDYPIAALEHSLTRAVGERVNMVDLHYDFDTAARLICA